MTQEIARGYRRYYSKISWNRNDHRANIVGNSEKSTWTANNMRSDETNSEWIVYSGATSHMTSHRKRTDLNFTKKN